MKFKKYHKIPQFRDVVRNINYAANFEGLDEQGEPIYNEGKEKPTLTFLGSTKLHGSNASISYTPEGGVKPGKRSSFLGDTDNHFNFNLFCLQNKDYFEGLLKRVYATDENEYQINLHGEWAGNGIQKGVAISELPKGFYIFDISVVDLETEEVVSWLPNGVISSFLAESPDNIYSIYDFKTWSIDIDFNKPALVQNQLNLWTLEVENECPVASALGVKGTGEGIVWTSFYKGQKYIFKVKGTKHSSSKIKTLAKVDTETLNSIYEFVDYACTENRVLQGIQEVSAKEKSDTPDLLRWVARDIMAEEADTLKENKLEWKQVAKEVANRTRQIFFNEIDKT